MDHPSIYPIYSGVIFIITFGMAQLPFCSISTFLADRKFYQRENAQHLYPITAYYTANVTLELLFNTINGAAFGTIVWFLANLDGLVHFDDFVGVTMGFLGLCIATTVLVNVSIVIYIYIYEEKERKGRWGGAEMMMMMMMMMMIRIMPKMMIVH